MPVTAKVQLPLCPALATAALVARASTFGFLCFFSACSHQAVHQGNDATIQAHKIVGYHLLYAMFCFTPYNHTI